MRTCALEKLSELEEVRTIHQEEVVHHSIIVEFGKEIPSHRAQQAAQRIQQETPNQIFLGV